MITCLWFLTETTSAKPKTCSAKVNTRWNPHCPRCVSESSITWNLAATQVEEPSFLHGTQKVTERRLRRRVSGWQKGTSVASNRKLSTQTDSSAVDRISIVSDAVNTPWTRLSTFHARRSTFPVCSAHLKQSAALTSTSQVPNPHVCSAQFKQSVTLTSNPTTRARCRGLCPRHHFDIRHTTSISA